ncbi:hypothetical protein J8273_8457 [Carpediemonas membranifera]|uniref:Uncharacterized protein n=1 Tax=Carpediemonas membranifera TaxID=201153 RepID=A0A8J6AQU6_9EUKA|nr:hypothetical protein J8273_8457 [Carpediemonas membranifera]|eukprot:KAG9389780.1 hypothetical protein J8273_8457 [Carpediemonas membranifera]
MNTEALSQFLAPYLKKTSQKAWTTFREEYLAYTARATTPIPIHQLIAPSVLAIFCLRDPQLERVIHNSITQRIFEAEEANNEEPGNLLAHDDASDDSEGSDTEESSDSEEEIVVDPIPHGDIDYNEVIMNEIDEIFAPLDTQDALDRIAAVYFQPTDDL